MGMKTAALLVGLFATSASAQDLLPRYEAAQVALDGRMLSVMGSDPTKARWSPERRGKSACALAELERLRGRPVAEAYVREVEYAIGEAHRLTHAADFGGLAARIHRNAGIRFQRDLVPITRKCGIGL